MISDAFCEGRLSEFVTFSQEVIILILDLTSFANTMKKVNITEKLALFSDHWNPRIVGELNGQHVKLVKFKGAFVWHQHDAEDELFYVLKGQFDMEFRDRTVTIRENEFIIVPRGVEHRPVAEEEVAVMLFEPASTVNTGDAESAMTKTELEHI